MMTTFAVLMVIWQGIDWLGQKKILPGLAAVILPLAWPSWQASCLWPFPLWPRRWALPPTRSCHHGAPTGDSGWPVLVMGLVLYLFRKRRGVQVAAFSVYYILYGVVYMAGP